MIENRRTADTASTADTALFLDGGGLWLGLGFGAKTIRGGELVFNTGMTGYQEILTDPSYFRQVVVFTGAEVGNTGVNGADVESSAQHLAGVVVRNYSPKPSNWRCTGTLSEFLERENVPGIYGVDTRDITQCIRDGGARRSIIFPMDDCGTSDRAALERRGQQLLESVAPMDGLELVSQVSCKSPYDFNAVTAGVVAKHGTMVAVVYDFGVKSNILRSLAKRGFRVRVVPYNYPYQDVLKLKPSAVVLSNGPGDPAAVTESVEMIAGLLGKVPLFAVCMGHQLLARALGCSTYKLKFGHHGINHPVKDLILDRVLITSQNHGFAVSGADLASREIELTHQSLNDGCVEGFQSKKLQISSVQFHPESRPGPSDADYIFDRFVRGFVA